VCKFVGTDPERIFSEAVLLLEGNDKCRKVRNNVTVFGDGFAGRRIVDALLRRVRGCEDSQSTYGEDITQREKRMESQTKDEKPEMKNLLRAARPVSS
jgi:hypothetical protein